MYTWSRSCKVSGVVSELTPRLLRTECRSLYEAEIGQTMLLLTESQTDSEVSFRVWGHVQIWFSPSPAVLKSYRPHIKGEFQIVF